MKGKLSREGTELRLPVYIKHFCVCPSHFLHKGGGGGTNIFNTWRGDKHFYIHGGQTFSSSGGSGNDDFDCDEEEDVSKANVLARVLTVPEGPEILVYDNCHFMALYALC